jgi:RND family efflux transporter MFP subunit
MRRSPLLTALGLAALAATGPGCQRQEAPARAQTAAAPAARAVRVVAAAEGRLPRVVTVTGTLAADEQVAAAFKVEGRLGELVVDLGSRVRQGDLIARLDATDFRLRLEQAEAALRQARARLGLPLDGADDHVDVEETSLVREARAVLDEARLTRDRSQQLWKEELIARAQVDTAVAQALVAEGRYQAAIEEIRNRQAVLAERRSAVSLARQQLADTVLHAPIDGAVRERRAAVGEFLGAGAPVVMLVRVDPLRLRVSVPERDAPSVRAGQAVKVQVEGDPTEHRGRVTRLSPAIQEDSRTLVVEAEVTNPTGRLRPGAFARAEIVIDADRTAVLVPQSTIVTFAGLEKVIGVQDGRAVEKRVRTGRRVGDRVEVTEGLAAGEPVVVEPGNLTGGQAVAVQR